MESSHPAKFGGHRHCNSGDMILVSHMISQDQVIKWSSDFKALWLGPINVSDHPVKFGGHRYCDNGDRAFSNCHTISQDQVSQGVCDFLGRNSLRQVSLGALGNAVVDI